jgi:hypothetical protein
MELELEKLKKKKFEQQQKMIEEDISEYKNCIKIAEKNPFFYNLVEQYLDLFPDVNDDELIYTFLNENGTPKSESQLQDLIRSLNLIKQKLKNTSELKLFLKNRLDRLNQRKRQETIMKQQKTKQEQLEKRKQENKKKREQEKNEEGAKPKVRKPRKKQEKNEAEEAKPKVRKPRKNVVKNI